MWLWLAAGLALTGWYALTQRDAKIAAQQALRASESVIEALNNYAYDVAGIEAALRDGLEGLNAFPDTNGCGPVVDGALGRLRE